MRKAYFIFLSFMLVSLTSGLEGRRGPKGQKGETGDDGFCSCTSTDEKFNEISETVNTLQQEVAALKKYNLESECKNVVGGILHGDKCYFLTETTSRSFSDATIACGKIHEGSELASITSAELYEALVKYIRPKVGEHYYDIWTNGRYDPITGGNEISWTDGTSTEAWKWSSRYPRTGSNRVPYTHVSLQVRADPDSDFTGFMNIYDFYSQCHHLCSVDATCTLNIYGNFPPSDLCKMNLRP